MLKKRLQTSVSPACAARVGEAPIRTLGLCLCGGCVLAALLTGCGQKGPLYLPAPAHGTVATPAASAAASSSPASTPATTPAR